MKKIIQEFQKYTFLLPPLQKRLNKRRHISELIAWDGKPHSLPLPHLLKQDVLKGYAVEYNLSILVETGTYKGEMVEALSDNFKKIFSIELSETYAKKAQRYFRGQGKVKIIQGDSGEVIGELIKEIDRPTLFWLDGHYSADDTARGKKSTPVMEELSHILRAPDMYHVILIDDARAFGQSEDYPTLDALRSFILSLRKNVKVISEDDIIRILPE
jgi:hypothetical protein